MHGNILFINHNVENITYEDLEEELGYYDLDFVNIFKEDGHVAWFLKTKPEYLSTYAINDGWGDIGTGWVCPYCDATHPFESVYGGEEYVCGHCHETSVAKYTSDY